MRPILPTRPILAAVAAIALAAGPAHALRVVTWNLLQYPTSALANRQPLFRTVMANLEADILVAQELNSQAGRDSFLDNVLNVAQPGQWTATAWLSLGSGEGGAVFYKPSKVAITNLSAFATSGPRKVLQCVVKPVGYASNAAWFRLYSVHLKAGDPAFNPSDSTTRRFECTTIRSTINNTSIGAVGPNFLLAGDFNFYGAYEGGYIRLTESQANDNGRSKDVLNMPGAWHDVAGYAAHHTQSPCRTGCQAFFSTGGLDDRFDMILTSYTVQDSEGLDVVGYFAYGNDGRHFNDDIDGDQRNSAVPLHVATALRHASDHIPVVMTLQLPAKIAAASAVDFGALIVGATVTRTLDVANGATPPAAPLAYGFDAPPGFTAPSGSFVANAGAAPNSHALGIDSAVPGARNDALTVTSNDPDSAAKPVQLSGVVLRHAAASLDSLSPVASATLDLGAHPAGQFPDAAVRVHNLGYDPLQARLSVNSGVITGGAGRFSIPGGFTPALLAGTGRSYPIFFDGAGATYDSTYEATLVIASADEPLPGASPATELRVTLRARPVAGPTGAAGDVLPAAVRFHPPRPNPLAGETWLAFDLPAAARVSLEVFDLTGRRVTELASGPRAAGRHQVRWGGEDASGARVPAGVYLVRFRAPGLEAARRIAVLP